MMPLAKNYQNRPMFHGVIQKIKVARFFIETLCIKYKQVGMFVWLYLIVVSQCLQLWTRQNDPFTG